MDEVAIPAKFEPEGGPRQDARSLRTSAPVNFVNQVEFDEALVRKCGPIDLTSTKCDRLRQTITGLGEMHWIVLTYFYLLEAGFDNLSLSNSPRPECINVAHSGLLQRLGPQPECFTVSIRSDVANRQWPQFEIVQNQDQLHRDSVWIPLWPQYGIIAREAPVESIRRIGYLGQTFNGNLVWSEDEWAAFLAPLGVEFVARPMSQWHDFSDIDVALAIRSFGNRRYRKKPPSKLVNAWFGGVPFIGGADSAYTQIGNPGHEYLRATTPDEVRACIARLKSDPELTQRLVAAGHERAKDFTKEATLQRWVDVFEGPVEDRFRKWQAHPSRERLRTATLGISDVVVSRARRTARKVLNALAGPRA
jgi:hypothetical protein